MKSLASQAVLTARDEGRLGLTLYLIPGFPNADVYDAVFDLLERDQYVSVVETTLPVRGGFASYQNETIRKAHAAGIATFGGDIPQEQLKRLKPTLGVIYGESVEDGGVTKLLDRHPGAFNAVVFEQGCGDLVKNTELCAARGVETVWPVSADMPQSDLQWTVRRAAPGGYVYLSTAASTGGTLLSNEVIARSIDWIKDERPDVSVSAGFGVKTAFDVERLRQIETLDGVIIGTTFLQAMADGVEAAETFLATIRPSLVR